jgi:hypothetical protein
LRAMAVRAVVSSSHFLSSLVSAQAAAVPTIHSNGILERNSVATCAIDADSATSPPSHVTATRCHRVSLRSDSCEVAVRLLIGAGKDTVATRVIRSAVESSWRTSRRHRHRSR